MQAPNVVLQTPSSPFSPAKPPQKAAPQKVWEAPLPSCGSPDDARETAPAPDAEQGGRKGMNKTLALAVITAIGAAIVAGA
jgi:hypothetical protein